MKKCDFREEYTHRRSLVNWNKNKPYCLKGRFCAHN